MSGLKLFLLGPPRVEIDGSPLDIKRRKALAMLIYLAVTGQPHSRDALATLFYPNQPQSRARAYLRRDLAVLNTSLDNDWLDADRETVELKPGFWADVTHFRKLVAECQQHDHLAEVVCSDCVSLLMEAAELYADDFLVGFTLRDCPEFDEWQFFEAEGLRQVLASVLERLVGGLSGQERYEAAIPYARRLGSPRCWLKSAICLWTVCARWPPSWRSSGVVWLSNHLQRLEIGRLEIKTP